MVTNAFSQRVHTIIHMSNTDKTWTGNLLLHEHHDSDQMVEQLCAAFNQAPFFQHVGMQMRVRQGQIEGYFEMQPYLIGNKAFQILHGGVAATFLDSVGGVIAMAEVYHRRHVEDLHETSKKISRLATVDMRVDYLAPGRGQYFIARGKILRFGRKGCTVRMTMVNDEEKAIATAIASYAY